MTRKPSLFFLLTVVCFLASPANSTEQIIKVSLSKNPPLVFTDDKGKAQGIYIDVIEHIAGEERWTIQYVACKWRECQQKLQNGDIDLLMSIAYTKERAQKFDFTKQPVFNNWAYIYRMPGSNIESIVDLEGQKVATVKGNIHSKGFVKTLKSFDIQSEIIEVNDYPDVFRLIDERKVSAGVVNRLNGLKYEAEFNAEKTPIIFNPVELLFATPKGKNSEIRTTIDMHMKTLKKDKNSIYYQSLNKWLRIGGKALFPVWLKWTMVFGVGVLVLLVVMNQILRFKIKQRTEELRDSHEKLEDQVEERTAELVKANEQLKQEIEERKRAEETLRLQGEIAANMAEGVYLVRVDDGVIVFANPKFEEIFGYNPGEMVGKHVSIINAPAEMTPEEAVNQIVGIIKKTRVWQGEIQNIKKDGTPFWCYASASIFEHPEYGEIIISVHTDIDDHKRAENALLESEEKYRSLFEESRDAIYINTREGYCIDANQSMLDLFGYTRQEMINMNSIELYFNPEDRQRVLEELDEKGFFRDYEINYKKKDGTKMENLTTVSVRRADDGSIIGYQGIIRDISETKRLEAQLQQAQKLEAMGTLAGGIAHDFNNLLMGIQGNASIMLLDLESTHSHYEKLQTIEKMVQSGSKLTGQLLGYARKGRYEVKPFGLNQLVMESSETFGRTRKEITIHIELSKDLYAIEADRVQIEQVLLNLYVNAADAMPGGGDLLLKTMNITHEDMKSKLYNPRPGKYVHLNVTDTGTGMDKKTSERIFDPFFTTKEMSRGTGLGLASAYGIIKAHGGYIAVYSEIGEGTSFSIYLPASEKEVAKEEAFPEDILKGTETVLFVDDENVIIDVGDNMLKELGYNALIARSGKEAIELYEKKKREIDMVILDMIMPGIGGGEAYDRMKKINPNIKVLLSSGYSIGGQAEEIIKRGCSGFIQKPFDIKELSQKLREILDKK